MKKLLPPTHLLRAFLATADLGSAARAAETLHLTPGAVSKQIAELEKWLAVPLFDRVRKRLVLTPQGNTYRDALAPALRQVEAATLDVMRSREGAGVIHLSVLSSVAQRWLDPKLPEFSSRYPLIELRYAAFSQSSTLSPNSTIDAVIRYGRDATPGVVSDYLVGKEVVLIAPPTELMKHPLDSPGDLRHHTLIHHELEPDGWRIWCEVHRVQGIDLEAGPRLTLASSIINGVRAGVGVALMPLCLVVDEIQQGSLTAPFPVDTHEAGGYYLCSSPRALEQPAYAQFRSWLLGKAGPTPFPTSPSPASISRASRKNGRAG